MAVKIAVINQKGGAGKTTTALCLTECLAGAGKKVLLVDADQQHNATKQYGAAIDGEVTVYDLLTDPGIDARASIQRTECGDIVAGDGLICNAEAEMASLMCRETILADAIDKVEKGYDIVVYDCPPSLGLVTRNILVASDQVIIPIVCDGYSNDGVAAVARLVESIKANKRLNPALALAGIVVTQYEPGQIISRSYDEQLPLLAATVGTKAYATRIRRCVKTKEAQLAGRSLYAHAPACTTALDYEAFAHELLADLCSASDQGAALL